MDSAALGWPSWLWAVAALLVNEVSKLTLWQHLDVLTPHQVQSVLEVKGHHWLTGRKLTRYQTLVTNILDITFKVCQTLNPATLLSVVKSGDLMHQCMRNAHSCPTLCNPLAYSLSVSSVHGILQARIVEWVAISFSRGSSWPKDQTWGSCIAGRLFTVWATRGTCVIIIYHWWMINSWCSQGVTYLF